MADELEPGTVVEGRGGKKYVYKGGDRQSKDSYTAFEPEPAKAEPPNKALAALEGVNNAASNALKLNPLYQAANQASQGVQNAGHMLEQGAYDVGGKVTDATGSPALGYGANVATQAIPSILSGSAMQHAAGSILKPAGRYMMRSALKPTSATPAEAKQAVETLLKEGVNVTPGGAAKLGEKVNVLTKQVDEIISQAGREGKTVNKHEIAKRIDDTLKKFEYPGDPKDISTIRRELKNFLEHKNFKGMDEIPVEAVQEFKRGMYKSLNSRSFGELKGPQIEAQKDLARGAKETLEEAIPAVAAPNAKQHELLNALELVGKRAEVAGNKNPIGLGALSENPGAAALFALDRSELVKSILGRLLYSGAPSVLRDATRLGVAGGMSLTANE